MSGMNALVVHPQSPASDMPTCGQDLPTKLPAIPSIVLQKHLVNVASDDRYRAAIRLMAALWREDEGLPVGRFVNKDGNRKLGSRISDKAGRSGRNFMSADIARLAEMELTHRQFGALYDATRLRTNLLASQTLAFNLFGPLKLDKAFAGAFIEHLLPGGFKEVEAVFFEFSPGRGDPLYSGDFTAVDVFVAGVSVTGQRTFVAIELKYAENCSDAVPIRFSARHGQIVKEAGIFLTPEDPALYANPLQQLLREHALAQSMIDRGQFDTGTFIVIAPAANLQVHAACSNYRDRFADPADDKVGFASITLEKVIEAIGAAGQDAYAQKLYGRYCDFDRVEAVVSAAAV